MTKMTENAMNHKSEKAMTRKTNKAMTSKRLRVARRLNKLTAAINKSHLVYGGVIASQLAITPAVLAGPKGGTVVGGQGDISRSGLNTNINQATGKLAIDWQSFNVNANEVVNFAQPSSSAIVLNRILDQSPSAIHGQINANGHVVLVNPRGILFTETSSINVGALTASGLDISPTDFMNGDMWFKGVEGEDGTVINRGVINASSVALLGKQVTNDATGLISADVISLSAADEALLTFDQDGMIGVKVTKAVMENDMGVDSAVLNSGEINGQQVLMQAKVSQDLFTQAVNNTGTIRARGIDTSGGKITLFGSGSSVVNKGTLDASGDVNGGSVELTADKGVINTGTIDATGAFDGGSIELKGGSLVENSGALDASGGVDGGSIHIEGDKAINTGNVIADGGSGTGGEIKILGDEVEVVGDSYVSAQGDSGGGEILIGGDYQGENLEVRNATQTTIGVDAQILAAAREDGNGGKVIVWANEDAYFYGFIDASSGVLGGDGGFIETSGKINLTVQGNVVAKAHTGGEAGVWLLDPKEFLIDDAYDTSDADILLGVVGFSNGISSTQIESILNGGTSIVIKVTDFDALSDRRGEVTATHGAITDTVIGEDAPDPNFNDRNTFAGGIRVHSSIETTVTSNNVTLTLETLGDGGIFVESREVVGDVGIDATYVYGKEKVRIANTAGDDAYQLNVVLKTAGEVKVNNAEIVTTGGDFTIQGLTDAGAASVNITDSATINTAGVDDTSGAIPVRGVGGVFTAKTSGDFSNAGTINTAGGKFDVSTGGSFVNSGTIDTETGFAAASGLADIKVGQLNAGSNNTLGNIVASAVTVTAGSGSDVFNFADSGKKFEIFGTGNKFITTADSSSTVVTVLNAEGVVAADHIIDATATTDAYTAGFTLAESLGNTDPADDKVTVTASGISFDGTKTVNADAISLADQVIAGDKFEWTVSAANIAKAVNLTDSAFSVDFTGIDSVTGANTLITSVDSAVFDISGDNTTDIAVTTSAIKFTGLSASVTANGGSATINNNLNANSDETFALVSDTTKGNDAKAKEVVLSRPDGGGGGSIGFNGVVAVTNTRRLQLTDKNNELVISTLTSGFNDSDSGINFTGVSEYDGGGGTGTDTLKGLDTEAWSLSEDHTLTADSAAGLSFTGFEIAASEAGTPSNNATLTDAGTSARIFTVAGDNSVSAAVATGGIRFDNIATVNASSDGADSVVLGSGATKAWTLKSANSVEAHSVTFNNIEQAGAVGDAATVTASATDGGTWELQAAVDNAVKSQGVAFKGIARVNQKGNVVVDAATNTSADTISIAGSQQISANGIVFGNNDSVAAAVQGQVVTVNLDSSDLVTDTAASAFTDLKSDGSFKAALQSAAAQTISFTGADFSKVAWSEGDSVKFAGTHGFGGGSFDTKKAIFVGSDSGDIYTITADSGSAATISYDEGAQGDLVTLQNVVAVQAGESADTSIKDKAINNAGSRWQLQVNSGSTDALSEAVKTGSVSFTNLELAEHSASTGSLVASADKDALDIIGTKNITANGITFSDITSAEDVSADDTITESQALFYELHSESVTVSSIEFKDVAMGAFSWDSGDSLGLAQGHGLVDSHGSLANAIETNGASIKGSTGSDSFGLESTHLTYKRGDSTGTVFFKNSVTSSTNIDGNNPASGTDTDTITSNLADKGWALNADHSLTHGDYTLSNVEATSGGNGALDASAATTTQFSLVNSGSALSNSQVRVVDTTAATTVPNITMSGITEVTGGTGASSLEGASGQAWQLEKVNALDTTAKGIKANAISFRGITEAVTADGSDNASLTGSTLTEVFTLGTGAAEDNWASVNDITFKNTGSIDGDSASGDNSGAVDKVVSTSTNQHWYLVDKSTGEFKNSNESNAISVVNVERAEVDATTVGVIELTTRSGGSSSDSLAIGDGAVSWDLGDSEATSDDRIAFAGVGVANISKNENVFDDGANDYLLTSSYEATVDGVTLKGKKVDGALNSNFWSSDDTLLVDADNYDFTDATVVEANGADLRASSGSDIFQLNTGASAGDLTLTYKVGGADAKAVTFNELSSVDGNGGAADKIIGSGAAWQMGADKNAVGVTQNAAGIDFTDVDLAEDTSGGSLTGNSSRSEVINIIDDAVNQRHLIQIDDTAGLKFTGLSDVTVQAADSLTATESQNYLVASATEVTVSKTFSGTPDKLSEVTIHGLTTTGATPAIGWGAGDAVGLATNHSFNNDAASFASITAGGATLLGSAGDDTFTMQGASDIDYINGASASDAYVRFTGVGGVDAQGQSSADHIVGLGTETWALQVSASDDSVVANNSLSNGTIVFEGIESVANGASVSSAATAVETVYLKGSKNFAVNSINFANVASVSLDDGDQVDDSLISAGLAYTIKNAESALVGPNNIVNVADIDISGASLSNYSWGSGDTLALLDDAQSALNGKSLGVKGAQLLGTTGADIFALINATDLNYSRDVAGAIKKVTFTGVGSVDGLESGDATDATVDQVIGLEDQTWTLGVAGETVTAGASVAAGITFSNVEKVGAVSGDSTLNTAASGVKAFSVTGDRALTTNGMDFTNIATAVLDSDDTQTDTGINAYELIDSNSFSVANIQFDDVIFAKAGWGSDDTLAMQAGKGFNTASAIDANSAKLLGSDGDDTYTVTSKNALTHQYAVASTNYTMQFTDVANVDAGSDGTSGDKVIGANSQNFTLTGTDNQAVNHSITFSAVENLQANNAGLVGKADTAETVKISDGGSLDVWTNSKTAAMTVTGVNKVTLQSETGTEDTVEDDGNLDYELKGTQEIIVEGVTFVGLDVLTSDNSSAGNFQWDSGDTLSLASGHTIANTADKAIAANGAKLNGTAGEDTFIIGGGGALTFDDVYFSGVTDVDAGDMDDLVQTEVSAATWQRNAGSSVTSSGITFTGAETFQSNDSAGTFKGFSSTDIGVDDTDTARTNGNYQLWVDLDNDLVTTTSDRITFMGISNVTLQSDEGDTFGSDDAAITTHYQLVSNKVTDVNSIRVTGVASKSFTWGASDTLSLAKDHAYTAASAAIETGGAKLYGSTGADIFTITGDHSLSLQIKDSVEAVKFTEVVEFSGDDNNTISTGEDLVDGLDNQTWYLADNSGKVQTHKVASSGITFENVESVNAANASVDSAAGTDHALMIRADNNLALDVDGDTSDATDQIVFGGVVGARINAGDSVEDKGDQQYTLYSSSEAKTSKILFSGRDLNGAAETISPWEAGDILSLSEAAGSEFVFDGSVIDANSATVAGSAAADTFVVTAPGNIDYRLASSVANTAKFTRVGAVIANAVDAGGSVIADATTDKVEAAGAAWSLSATAEEAFTVGTIAFSEVESAEDTAGTGTVEASNSRGETFEIRGDNTFKVAGTLFDGINTVNGDDADTVTDTGVQTYLLTDADTVDVALMTFNGLTANSPSYNWGTGDFVGLTTAHTFSSSSGFSSIVANGAKLQGSLSGDTFSLRAATDVDYVNAASGNSAFVRFTGVGGVDGNGGTDSVTDYIAADWTLQDDGAPTAAAKSKTVMAGSVLFEQITNIADAGKVIGSGAVDNIKLNSDRNFSVHNMNFTGAANLTLQAIDTVAETAPVDLQYELHSDTKVLVSSDGLASNALTIEGLGFDGDQYAWGAGDKLSLATSHTVDSAVSAKSATLLGSANSDSFAILAAADIDLEGVRFNTVGRVLAGDGSEDTVVGLANQAWSLTGSKELSNGSVTFENIEIANASGDANIDATAIASETFIVSGSGSVSGGDIAFSSVASVTLDSDDTVKDDNSASFAYTISGDATNTVTVADIDFKSGALRNFGWSAETHVDTIALTADHGLVTAAEIDANGATLVSGAGVNTYTVTGAEQLSYKLGSQNSVNFINLSKVAAAGSSDTATGALTQDWTLFAVDQSAENSGITFDGVETLIANNAGVNASSAAESFVVKADGSVDAQITGSSASINIQGLSAANKLTDISGLTSADAVNVDRGAGSNTYAYSLVSQTKATINELLFEGLAINQFDWRVNDTLSLALETDHGISSVDANHATLVGTDQDDSFTVTSANALTYNTLDFINVSKVDAGDADTEDTVFSQVDKALWQRHSATGITTSGIAFENAERFITIAGNGTFQGLNADGITGVGEKDTVITATNKELSLDTDNILATDTDRLTFEGISTAQLDVTDGDNFGATGLSNHYELIGESLTNADAMVVNVNSIVVEGLSSNSFTWSDTDTLSLAENHSFLATSAAINTKGAALYGSNGSDIFTITAVDELDFQRSGAKSDIKVSFTGVVNIFGDEKGSANSAGDTVIDAFLDTAVSTDNHHWTASDHNSFVSDGISFHQIDSVSVADGAGKVEAVVTSRDDAVGDSYTVGLTADQQALMLTALDMELSDVASVTLGAKDSVLDAGAGYEYELASDTEVVVSIEVAADSVAFSGGEQARFVWGDADFVSLADQHSVGTSTLVELNQATLKGSDGVDNFAITDDSTLSFTRSHASGSANSAVKFTGVTDVDAGLGADKATSALAGQQWQIAGSHQVTASQISFSGIEQVQSTGAGATVTANGSTIEEFAIADHSVSDYQFTSYQVADAANAIRFSGIDSVALDANDFVVDSDSHTYMLMTETSAVVEGVTYSGANIGVDGVDGQFMWDSADSVALAQDHSALAGKSVDSKGATLKGDETIATSFDVNAAGTVTYSSVDFTSLNKVAADNLAANYTVSGATGQEWQINGANNITAKSATNDVAFSNIKNVVAAASSVAGVVGAVDTFTVESAADAFETEVSSNWDIRFTGLQAIELQQSAAVAEGDSFSASGAATYALLDLNNVTVNQVGFSGVNLSLTDPTKVAWGAGDSLALETNHALDNNATAIFANGATLQGGAMNDHYEVGSTSKEVRYFQDYTGAQSGVLFSDVASVMDQGGSDTLVGMAAKQAWTLTGAKQVKGSDVVFDGIDQVTVTATAQADLASITVTASDSIFTIDGDNATTAAVGLAGDTVAFTGVGTVTLPDSPNHKLDSSGDLAYMIESNTEVAVNQITFAGLGVDNHSWGAGDTIALSATHSVDSSGLAGGSLNANQATLLGSDQQDTFSLPGFDDGSKALDYQRNNTGNTVLLRNVASVQGEGGDDLLTTTNASQQWQLNSGSNNFSANNIEFSAIKTVAAQNSGATLKGVATQANSFDIESSKTVDAAGMRFTGIDSISGGARTDTLNILNSSASTQLQLGASPGEVTVEDISASAIEVVNATDATLLGTSEKEEFVVDASSDIAVKAIRFSGVKTVNGVTGGDTVSASAAQWSASAAQAVASIQSVSVIFTNVDTILNTGTFNGSNSNNTYSFSDINTMDYAGFTFAGVNQLNAGSATDVLQGSNLDSSWNLAGDSGSVSSAGQALGFSGFEQIEAGAGTDTVTMSSGSLANLSTGGGNDIVYLNGGRINTVDTGSGNDRVVVNSASSAPATLIGGSGVDDLDVNVGGLEWRVTGAVNATNYVGDFGFSQFENLGNNVGSLDLYTTLATTYDRNSVSFNGAGMTLTFNGSNDVVVDSLATGADAVTGTVVANRFDLSTSGDVDIDTEITGPLKITSNGSAVDVDVSALEDLEVEQILTNDGDIVVSSKNFGKLSFSGRGETHLEGENVDLGTPQEQWTEIGDYLIPARVDASTLDIVSFSYVEPEFVGQTPVVTATGDKIESLSGAEASQGLKSAVQNAVEDFAQVDPGIFDAVSPYSIGVDAVYNPEVRLIAGILLPTEATAAGGDDEEEERETSAQEPVSDDQTGVKLPELREDFPEKYEIEDGDTLWDIAEKYLKDPMMWSELWKQNPEMKNPDLIFPGDVIKVIIENGKAFLTIRSGEGDDKLKQPLSVADVTILPNRSDFAS